MGRRKGAHHFFNEVFICIPTMQVVHNLTDALLQVEHGGSRGALPGQHLPSSETALLKQGGDQLDQAIHGFAVCRFCQLQGLACDCCHALPGPRLLQSTFGMLEGRPR